MAYMNQERKKAKAPAIAAICKKYGVKARLGVENHSTLVLNISSGSLDFAKSAIRNAQKRPTNGFPNTVTIEMGYIDVNPYYVKEQFTGAARDFLVEALAVMNDGNHDNSDSQSDYFDVGWYVGVNIGRWDKPYQLVK